ncbi:MAG: hypothetical protein RBS16_01940 [Candidatus Cloacimonadales bacterium]|jgi:hypothetical protein|nr:hypothetical protein [Candidatus Cloacimonadota bacterium]MDX9976774.1 hypothetical protein [Candidatus Cloacimonadales bacterium]
MIYNIHFLNPQLQIQHSLDTHSALDPKLSEQKIAGTDYFSHEPVRLEFTTFPDQWLTEHLLSGNYESDRYIWQYLIRYYINYTLVFTGIVDTSLCSYDEETEEIKITAHDKLKLFEKYQDQKMLYALSSGYTPIYIPQYLAQRINQKTQLPVNVYSAYTPLTINKTDIKIHRLNWRDEILSNFKQYTIFSGDIIAGFTEIDNKTTMIIKIKGSKIEQQGNNEYHGTYKIQILTCTFYNNICPYQTIKTYDFDYGDTNINQVWNQYNYPVSQDFTDLKGNQYQIPFEPNEVPVYPHLRDENQLPEHKEINFSGNIITMDIYPKGFYENKGEQTEQLQVLKAMLILHNLTLKPDPNGNIQLKNKTENNNTLHNIEQEDIIKLNIKRLNRPSPETNTLDILLGETDALKEHLTQYYQELASQKFEIQTTIDNTNNYHFQLFDQITIKGISYTIAQIEKDIQNDNWIITAWQ